MKHPGNCEIYRRCIIFFFPTEDGGGTNWWWCFEQREEGLCGENIWRLGAQRPAKREGQILLVGVGGVLLLSCIREGVGGYFVCFIPSFLICSPNSDTIFFFFPPSSFLPFLGRGPIHFVKCNCVFYPFYVIIAVQVLLKVSRQAWRARRGRSPRLDSPMCSPSTRRARAKSSPPPTSSQSRSSLP